MEDSREFTFTKNCKKYGEIKGNSVPRNYHGSVTNATLRNAKSVIYIKSSDDHCGLETAREALSTMDAVFDVDANHLSERLPWSMTRKK